MAAVDEENLYLETASLKLGFGANKVLIYLALLIRFKVEKDCCLQCTLLSE